MNKESGVKIILSNQPEEVIQSESRFKLPHLPNFMDIFCIFAKVLPFYITLFSLKCLLAENSDYTFSKQFKESLISNPHEPEELNETYKFSVFLFILITYILTIIYHLSTVAVHCKDSNSENLINIIWLDPNFHRLVLVICIFAFQLFQKLFFFSNTLYFFYESVKIFDCDVARRTKNLYFILHQYCQLILLSKFYLRLRAFAEFLEFPYLLFLIFAKLDLNLVILFYFYFVFIVMYKIQVDESYYWIWLQVDTFCTNFAFRKTEKIRPVLLKALFTIRNLGSIGRKIYPINSSN